MKRASITFRFFAFLIDLAFLLCVSVLLVISGLVGSLAGVGAGGASSSDLFSALSAFASILFFFEIFLFLFYFTYLSAHDEKTIGKAVFGLKVVRRSDNGPPGVLRSLARSIAYLVSAVPLFLGFWMAFLLRGLALHDIIAGTAVVKEE